jgi:hypothetical protein
MSRRAGLPPEEGVRFESDGQGEYTLHTLQRKARGTEVALHLREGEDEFLNGYRLREIIHKYSWPGERRAPRTRPKRPSETGGQIRAPRPSYAR